MADRIRVLIVDDIPETRDHLTKLLGFESDIEVVGAAASGAEALELAGRLSPDVVLMDINMPGMDGIATTEQLSSRLPQTSIVMMSVQGEADYLRRSMLAGAREFLVKPFSADELVTSIRQVYAREREKLGRMVERAAVTAAATGEDGAEPRDAGRIVTVFSPKGGVGRTTLAVNLAVAAAIECGKRGLHRGRQLPVRRCRRAAQPEPQEQVDRRHPRRRRRGARQPRLRARQPLLEHPRPAGAAQPRDGRAGHALRLPPDPRGAPARRTTWSSSTPGRRSTRRPSPCSTCPT